MGGWNRQSHRIITCTAHRGRIVSTTVHGQKRNWHDVGWISWCRIFWSNDVVHRLPDDSLSGKVALAGSCPTEEIWKQERSRMAKLLKQDDFEWNSQQRRQDEKRQRHRPYSQREGWCNSSWNSVGSGRCRIVWYKM
jgi:hypothetical protein